MLKEQLNGELVFVIRDFFSTEECDAFIAQSESAGYDEATITTAAGAVMNKSYRDNSRLILDDLELAQLLWLRAEPFIATTIRSIWTAIGFNERFRFYRYGPGERFKPHIDGCFRRQSGEESMLTFMIYLNDDFTEGQTKFYSANGTPRLIVKPEKGMALVFDHRQMHEGAPVAKGRKYVLRTDVMYQRGDTISNS